MLAERKSAAVFLLSAPVARTCPPPPRVGAPRYCNDAIAMARPGPYREDRALHEGDGRPRDVVRLEWPRVRRQRVPVLVYLCAPKCKRVKPPPNHLRKCRKTGRVDLAHFEEIRKVDLGVVSGDLLSAVPSAACPISTG